jgi:hypothetical protein
MCGGSSKATAYQPKPYNYTPTPAPYGTSGTATSAGPVASSEYPSYGNRYQPAQSISQGNYAQLGAMRDAVMGRASGMPQVGMQSAPQIGPSGLNAPAQNVPAPPPVASPPGQPSGPIDVISANRMYGSGSQFGRVASPNNAFWSGGAGAAGQPRNQTALSGSLSQAFQQMQGNPAIADGLKRFLASLQTGNFSQ